MPGPRGVLISGASTGIGAAAAELLANNGFRVFAGVRNAEDAARLEAIANVRSVTLDVTDESSIQSALREIDASGTPLFAVVSNAGIAVGGPLETLPMEDLRRQFEVNVFGAFRLVQASLPRLAEGHGRVVFVGSISGRLAMPYIAPYSASKFALRALSDALRVELAPSGIAVTLIEPGSVKTPIWQKGRDAREAMVARIGPGARAHYRQALEAVMETTANEERSGMDVSIVANAVLTALTSAKPRAQQILGGGAKAGSVIAMLPASLRDRLMRSAMRLP